ncbi:hypothetical protein [Laceyella putida]|uniref:Uncharacterized protein n=1 Tax=Laceyella putida TaxID=110101 RepID=A0ABW2RLC0_9BACL
MNLLSLLPFLQHTVVCYLTDIGQKPIYHNKLCDWVLSKDAKTGKMVCKRMYKRYVKEIL